jgi:hypothetical protein
MICVTLQTIDAIVAGLDRGVNVDDGVPVV